MMQRFKQNDRRILKSPAVHPCEGISPATLLDSLINLSKNICSYKTKFFATQRKNAREAIRQIGILLIFFEEIRETKFVLWDSTLLCLSELHLAFQKIQFLFEDCTREGAKLWVLMKAHSISAQFRTLTRSIATALDVLPLGSIEVAIEIKELVEMVGRQARNVKLEVDESDDDAMKRVILILNQFENKLEPEPSKIKRVLDYLGIKSWGDCQMEIKFLDEEISLNCQDGDEREVPLLSSLSGFMCYCRGTLFETIELGASEQADDARNNVEMLSCLNPEDFRCPISLELMTDPVTVSTGQTYDRGSIQKWLKSGNFTCPKTGARLSTTELVPNTSLRKLIQQFCADNGVSLTKSRKKNRDISRTIVAGSPAAAEAIKFLAGFLADRLYFGKEEHKNMAAYEIRLLAKSNIFNRSCLIQAGTIPFLLNLLISNDPNMQENAIAALLKLSKHSNGKKSIIENRGLQLITAVLKEGLKLVARQIAAATIFYLSSVREYSKLIGETPEAIPALVELVKNGTACGKKNAVVAIFGLLSQSRNHHKVLAARAVPVIVDLMASSDQADIIIDSLAVLATLSESAEGSISIIQTPALQSILDLIRSLASRVGKEYCVSILLFLCNNCGVDVVAMLAKDPMLMSSLYTLWTDGTSPASKKARLLIKILQNFNESNASRLATNETQQEQFIHVR